MGHFANFAAERREDILVLKLQYAQLLTDPHRNSFWWWPPSHTASSKGDPECENCHSSVVSPRSHPCTSSRASSAEILAKSFPPYFPRASQGLQSSWPRQESWTGGLSQPGGSEFQSCPSQVVSSVIMSPQDLCLVHATVLEIIHDKNIICPPWLQNEGVKILL